MSQRDKKRGAEPAPRDASEPEAASSSAASEPSAPAPAPRGVASLPADLALLAPEALPRALNTLWRSLADRDTPTLLQLAGRVVRVDVDAPAGYVAVQTPDDTHRVLGVRADALAFLVAHLTEQPLERVREALAAGPARLEARQPPAPASAKKPLLDDEAGEPG